MLKKTIVYENPFTEQKMSEEHYFHISKADLVQMEMEEHDNTYTKDGKELTGMQAKLQRIVDSQNGKAIMAELRDMIRRSYGKKDGDRFLKSSEIWEGFASTEAYSQLIFELCTNAEAASEFMNGIIPNNLEQIAAEVRAQATAIEVEVPDPTAVEPEGTELMESNMGPRPAVSTEPKMLTKAEIEEMDSDELKSGLATGRYKLS